MSGDAQFWFGVVALWLVVGSIGIALSPWGDGE